MDEQARADAIYWLCKVETGLTRSEIARGLGLRKHPALNEFIEGMVKSGHLEKAIQPSNRKIKTFWYRSARVFEDA